MGFGRGLFGRRRPGAADYAAFGQRALDVVRARPGVLGAEFDEDEFAITYRTPAGSRCRIGLITVFRRVEGVAEPAAEEMLAEYVLAMVGMPEAAAPAPAPAPAGWDLVAPRLRPLMRSAAEIAARIEGMSLADHTLWRPVLPYLVEKVVIDAPAGMTTVTPQHLAEWGVDAETVFATARDNMTELAFGTVDAFDPAQRDLLYLPDEDGELYAGSLPLVPGWITGLGHKSGVPPLVFVTGGAGVLMGLATSPDRVFELVGIARRLYEEAPRPVSPVPYTVDAEGSLVPFAVPRDHPAWPAIRSAESTLAAQVYRVQSESLRADGDAGLIDHFAADLMHVRGTDGTEATVTTWTDTVPTLLPYAHHVSLTDVETGATFAVPWEALAREVFLDPEPGLFPVRYRVEFHPDRHTMARLASATSLF